MFNPRHSFALLEISLHVQARIRAMSSGRVGPLVYICTSVKNFGYVSGLARSLEKNTPACTAFNSTRIPSFSQLCFTISWVFCRTGLTLVWYTTDILTPPLARIPSAPFAQPASSSNLLALSRLYSHVSNFVV